MAALKWQQDMATGIGLIDDQHKVIVDYVNRLSDAVDALDSMQVEDVLGKFAAYLKRHFEFEERLQQEAGYPFLDAHHRLHANFFARLENYRERFRHGEDVTGELRCMLADWLVDHLKYDDKDYVPAVSESLRRRQEL